MCLAFIHLTPMIPNSTSLILCNAVVARYTNVVDGFVTIASGDQRDAD